MDQGNELGQRGRASEPAHALKGVVVAGAYRITDWLASGGMGDVYQAEHVRLGVPVAIKVLRANALADPRAMERFRNEARRVARVRHENVIQVFDCGELADGTPYLVMERLFGEDLRSLLSREGCLPIRRAVKLLMDACRGLGAVHAAGLVHRDLKPANLFVERRSDRPETCRILDFGVAKALASETTHPGAVLGTLRYMAPEQLENAATTKSTADVYALGAILYECLTGVMLRRGETVEETMFDILHRAAKPPSEFRALPPALEQIVLCALARDPEKRFANATELESALSPFGPAPVTPRILPELDAVTLADGEEFVRAARARRSRGPSGSNTKSVVALLVASAMGGWLMRGRAQALAPVAERAPTFAATPVTSATTPAISAHPGAPALEPAGDRASAGSTPTLPTTGRSTRPSRAAVPSRVRPSADADDSSHPIAGRFDPTDPYE